MRIISSAQKIQSGFAELFTDESRLSGARPEKIYFPQTTEDVQAIAAAARSPGLTLVGAQTGISGGSTLFAGTQAVCFTSMKRICQVKVVDNTQAILKCQPGVTLEAIAAFLTDPASSPVPGSNQLKPQEFVYPPDPTELSAQLGGTIATCASGARSYHYGSTRHYIQGLEVVLADGTLHTLRRVANGPSELKAMLPLGTITGPAVKNACGYYYDSAADLTDLFIGSEGTLGFLTAAWLNLVKRPQITGSLSFFDSADEALGFADFLRDAPFKESILAIEYFDEYALALASEGKTPGFAAPTYPGRQAVYWEFADSPNLRFEDCLDLLEQGLRHCRGSLEQSWAGVTAQETARLKALRHGVPEAINTRIVRLKRDCPALRKIGTDTAVPRPVFAQFHRENIKLIEKAGLNYTAFGHLGDCHLHINLLPENQRQLAGALEIYDDIMRRAITCGGSVSAEHGIGKRKRPYLKAMYSRQDFALMRQIKKALDPDILLNRHTLFAPEDLDAPS